MSGKKADLIKNIYRFNQNYSFDNIEYGTKIIDVTSKRSGKRYRPPRGGIMKKEAVVSGETAPFGAKTDDQEVREKAGKLLFTDHGWTQVRGNGNVMLVDKYVDTIDKAMSEFKKAAKKKL